MALTKVTRGLLTTGIVDNSNATAITIDSSENVGIGTGSPAATSRLHVIGASGASNTAIYISQVSSNVALTTNQQNAGTKIHDIQWYETDLASLSVNVGGNGVDWNLGSVGSVGADTLQFTNVAGTERMRIDNSGHAIIGGGVTLGNGQTYAAANTLDDYEEGTWTPVTGPVSTTATYAFRSGYYTKVGRLVTCTFGLKHNGGVWTSGQSTISGLPFTVDNTGSYQEPNFIVAALGLAPTGQGGSGASGAFNLGEVSFFCGGGGTVGYGRNHTTNDDTVLAGTSIFATNSFIKATIIYYSS